jgi:putative ABC transport system permease protein
MSAFHAMRYRLHVLRRALFDRARWRAEMDAELTHHLELEAMQQRHGGASDDEARRAARRALGDPRRVRERIVDDSGASALDALGQDLRFAWRTLRASPGFTLVAVATLAIGIGANTAIFSAVNALLLRPLPFAAPEELLKVVTTEPARGDRGAIADGLWSYPKFAVLRDAQTVFRDLALWSPLEATLRGEGGAERVEGEMVDAHYLPTLGIRPSLGRNLAREEDSHPDGPRVALISDALWTRRFAADPRVVGRALDVDGQPFTIVGVLPRDFRGLSGKADVLLPVMSQRAMIINAAMFHKYGLIARRKPGVTPDAARAAVRQLGARVDEAYPDRKGQHWGAEAHPLDGTRVDPAVRRALLVVSGAVGLVLLIACANVANLLLVRATARQREIAVRLALGAGRGRLVRQLVTESVLLSTLGGAAGVAVAWWGARLLSRIDPANALGPRDSGALGAVTFEWVRLDLPALAFAAGLVVLTGLLFGLAPALQSTRPSLAGTLKSDGARVGAGARGSAARSALAAAEIALALVLLAGSGLMLKSLARLLAVRIGVDPSHVLTMNVGVGEEFSSDSLPAIYDQLPERLAAVPGVTGVALASCAPLAGGCGSAALYLLDRPAAGAGLAPTVGVHWITPDWPAVMRVPLVRGRPLAAADRAGARKVVLVNETAARRFWPNADPIGRAVSVGLGEGGGAENDTALVVGVVGDVRYATVDAAPEPAVYLSYQQSPSTRLLLHVRTAGEPTAVTAAARRAVAEVAPGVPVYDVRTMESRVADALALQRLSAVLLALFAAVALALATLGVYGVVSYAAAERTREMGIRVALGATRGDVARLVLRQGLAIALVGGAVGLAGALAATRVLRSLLYDVAPSDPATFAAVAALLLATVLVAGWTPARRAAAVAPTEALRAD